MITGYHYKFYLNANHAIYLNGQLGQTHPHTWEFSFEVINENKDFEDDGSIDLPVLWTITGDNKAENLKVGEKIYIK